MKDFTDSEIKKLSSKRALYYLMQMDNPDYELALEKTSYHKKLRKLQVELIKFQNWVVEKGQRILIIVEGGESAGKSDLIRAFVEHLNPRSYRAVALPKPNNLEKHQWYFRRYVKQLPQIGEIVLFDRSWYNRAVLVPVNNFCRKEEYKAFMNEVNQFEKLITSNELLLFKIYLKISKKEQANRLAEVKRNPLRYWELTEVDKAAQSLWTKFKRYEKKMFDKTNTKENPWIIINGNNKHNAHLETITHILNGVKYT